MLVGPDTMTDQEMLLVLWFLLWCHASHSKGLNEQRAPTDWLRYIVCDLKSLYQIHILERNCLVFFPSSFLYSHAGCLIPVKWKAGRLTCNMHFHLWNEKICSRLIGQSKYTEDFFFSFLRLRVQESGKGKGWREWNMYYYIQTHICEYAHVFTNINSTGNDVCSKHHFCTCYPK